MFSVVEISFLIYMNILTLFGTANKEIFEHTLFIGEFVLWFFIAAFVIIFVLENKKLIEPCPPIYYKIHTAMQIIAFAGIWLIALGSL